MELPTPWVIRKGCLALLFLVFVFFLLILNHLHKFPTLQTWQSSFLLTLKATVSAEDHQRTHRAETPAATSHPGRTAVPSALLHQPSQLDESWSRSRLAGHRQSAKRGSERGQGLPEGSALLPAELQTGEITSCFFSCDCTPRVAFPSSASVWCAAQTYRGHSEASFTNIKKKNHLESVKKSVLQKIYYIYLYIFYMNGMLNIQPKNQ